jgi:hypothetical protein
MRTDHRTGGRAQTHATAFHRGQSLTLLLTLTLTLKPLRQKVWNYFCAARPSPTALK